MELNSRKNQYLWLFFLLTTIILGFNSLDVFYTSTMYVDDHHRYILGLENRIHETIYARNSLRAYVIFPLYKLLSIDPVYARLAQVLVFYVPLSASFYILLRKYANTPKMVALISSVLPCVLPGQTMIPSFIDGSYTIQGLLVFNIALFLSIRFLKNKNSNPYVYTSAIAIIYGLSLEMMDHSIFLVPFSLVLFVLVSGEERNWRKIVIVSSVYVILAGLKSYQIINFSTVSASTTIDPSWTLFLSRAHSYIGTVLPYSYTLKGNALNPGMILLVYIVIVASALYVADRKERVLIFLGLLWAVCTSITFLTVSKYYSPRYAHISGFGVNLSLVYSVYILIAYGFRNRANVKYIQALLLISLLVYTGSSRMTHMYKFYASKNKAHEAIVLALSKFDFPLSAQVVILNGNRIPTGGWWNYSAGYIKYATGRKDMTGLIGLERFYYDPFVVSNRGYNKDHIMNGLDMNLPVFTFRQICDSEGCRLNQLGFALQWKADSWNLLMFDKVTGVLSRKIEGNGYDYFIKLLSQENIQIDQVAYGKVR